MQTHLAEREAGKLWSLFGALKLWVLFLREKMENRFWGIAYIHSPLSAAITYTLGWNHVTVILKNTIYYSQIHCLLQPNSLWEDIKLHFPRCCCITLLELS